MEIAAKESERKIPIDGIEKRVVCVPYKHFRLSAPADQGELCFDGSVKNCHSRYYENYTNYRG